MATTYPENTGVATSDEILQAKMKCFFYKRSLLILSGHYQRYDSFQLFPATSRETPGKHFEKKILNWQLINLYSRLCKIFLENFNKVCYFWCVPSFITLGEMTLENPRHSSKNSSNDVENEFSWKCSKFILRVQNCFQMSLRHPQSLQNSFLTL